MNATRFREELIALRARVDREIDEMLEQLAREEPANDSDWRRVPALAAELGYCAKTVHRYVAEARPKDKSAPHPFAIGEGKRTRIHRAKFLQWRGQR